MTREVVAVVGLGYVGLPLAVAFSGHHDVIAFDIDGARLDELSRGYDSTLEVSEEDLATTDSLRLTGDVADLREASVYIVTVPTPIDEAKRPDLGPLRAATETVGRVLDRGNVVVFESTVYPGATEEVCVPILEEVSGLRFNTDFGVGYSPERVNPGDGAHRLADVCKVTSGSNPEVADYVDSLYAQVITAGTHRASSIRVAEAAKVIENTQRDVNIALVNELAVLFNTLQLDTLEILEAAGTKWNFLPFRPGLVGGHCIGVDPYYLTFKAQQAGHHPEVILAGRRINDMMATYVADRVVLAMVGKRTNITTAQVLILGLSFKENCPDLRNSKVPDIVTRLASYGIDVDICDPWVDAEEAKSEYGVTLVDMGDIRPGRYEAVILAVAHRQFASMGSQLRELVGDGVLYDVKGVLGGYADERL